jgi:site-specific recombinase XerD
MTATGTRVGEIVSFLITRIDDDEAQIARLQRKARTSTAVAAGDDSVLSLRRLRLECRAKRKVIGAAQQLIVFRDLPNEHQVREEAWRTLRALASAYAHHPAFRDEWT